MELTFQKPSIYFRANPCDLDQYASLFLSLQFFSGNPIVILGIVELVKFLFTIVSLDDYYQSNSHEESHFEMNEIPSHFNIEHSQFENYSNGQSQFGHQLGNENIHM